MKYVVLLCLLFSSGMAGAAVLEGVGHANIRENNIDQARAEARKAAMRDLALQLETRVSSNDLVENGELVSSRTELSAMAKVRNASVVDEYRSGNLLRITVRAEVSEGGVSSASCKVGDASDLRKRVAVTGFPLVEPPQGGNRAVNDAGEELPQSLISRLQKQGHMQILGATRLQLFTDVPNAPTSQSNLTSNHLTNVVQLARELGAQFVVSGVIRNIGLADPGAWGSSIMNRMQRGIGLSDDDRRFEVELMVFDGFSGSPVYQKSFATSADWSPEGSGSGGFASAGFEKSKWGQAVSGVIDEMVTEVNDALVCQPFMARITRVDGDRVTLSSGATAGLRPGDELVVYRSRSYFDSLGGTPELQDAGVSVTLNNVHPDFSTGNLPTVGGQVNIQRDDLAIIW